MTVRHTDSRKSVRLFQSETIYPILQSQSMVPKQGSDVDISCCEMDVKTPT